ncbi:uncharacterized protein F4812DRAFT_98914 [Daldinia caldariorum]|uniref:uncharacterized protein n=1 Tax=Daldinia caldariorum TaxID=326644 RepID=UPI002007D308|nr:uncharacterized protein F4812DRAFT_98914 [Daldinia caldariorum]KAI1466160.1 hypothetical protein F4812DRAFT_98914 [Daldinia caldariorum]
MKFLSYTSLCALLATTAVAQLTDGKGEIHVVKSTSLKDALPANSIGCLDAKGGFTETDCATFTISDNGPNTLFLSSDAGNCTFSDTTQPANTDSRYGSKAHAFVCREDYKVANVDAFYGIDGLDNFLCRGNIDCFYDTKIVDGAASPVWEFFWGSYQYGVPAGHTQVMWYWNKV